MDVETRTPLPEMRTESRMRMRIQCFGFWPNCKRDSNNRNWNISLQIPRLLVDEIARVRPRNLEENRWNRRAFGPPHPLFGFVTPMIVASSVI